MAVRVAAGNNASAGLLRQLAALVEAGEFEVVEYESDRVHPERVWRAVGHDSPPPRPYVRYTVRVTVRDEVQAVAAAPFAPEIVSQAAPFYDRTITEEALQFAKEWVDDWEYAQDPHGYCHQRMLVVKLIQALEARSVT